MFVRTTDRREMSVLILETRKTLLKLGHSRRKKQKVMTILTNFLSEEISIVHSETIQRSNKEKESRKLSSEQFEVEFWLFMTIRENKNGGE